MHLVDVESRELVYALIVAAEGLGPLVTRTFEMEIPVGAVANKKISYTNPYPAFRTFTMRCNQPWLLQVRPCVCVCVCVRLCATYNTNMILDMSVNMCA